MLKWLCPPPTPYSQPRFVWTDADTARQGCVHGDSRQLWRRQPVWRIEAEGRCSRSQGVAISHRAWVGTEVLPQQRSLPNIAPVDF